jgi:HPr kinase/phosphorylase
MSRPAIFARQKVFSTVCSVHQKGAQQMSKKICVNDLVQQFKLEVLSGESGLKREVIVSDLYRPGLEMAGYFTYHPFERVQLLGKTEISFFETLDAAERLDRASRLCLAETPCVVVTRGLEVPAELLQIAVERDFPILRSQSNTTLLYSKITDYLERKLAPTTTIHGVLVDVYSVGMLIIGTSGIGKSETALELVKRGHRLIADDAVEIHQTPDMMLYGQAPDLIKHLLEIRGVGIINVMTLFGVGAVKNYTKISLVVKLETWQQDKMYDRLGLEEERMDIINTSVPLVTVPVKPGRNLAVIIEVAAMNYRLKKMGYNAALQFTTKLSETIMEDMEDND